MKFRPKRSVELEVREELDGTEGIANVGVKTAREARRIVKETIAIGRVSASMRGRVA